MKRVIEPDLECLKTPQYTISMTENGSVFTGYQSFTIPKTCGKNAGIRGKISGWSYHSRQRLREFLLYHSIPCGLRECAITLTVPGPNLSPVEAKTLFHSFQDKLNKSGAVAVWRMEVQERGQIHWHLWAGLPDSIDADWIKKHWLKGLKKLGWVRSGVWSNTYTSKGYDCFKNPDDLNSKILSCKVDSKLVYPDSFDYGVWGIVAGVRMSSSGDVCLVEFGGFGAHFKVYEKQGVKFRKTFSFSLAFQSSDFEILKRMQSKHGADVDFQPVFLACEILCLSSYQSEQGNIIHRPVLKLCHVSENVPADWPAGWAGCCLKSFPDLSLSPGAVNSSVKVDFFDSSDDKAAWHRYLKDHESKSKQGQIAEGYGRHWGVIGKARFSGVPVHDVLSNEPRVYMMVRRWLRRLRSPYIRHLDKVQKFRDMAYYARGSKVVYSNTETLLRMINHARCVDAGRRCEVELYERRMMQD